MKDITLVVIGGQYNFTGKYRKDLEKPNWHYYEEEKGAIIHCRKEHMIMVIEKPIEKTI